MDTLVSILYPILLVIVILAMIFLVILVLLQNDSSGGLGALGGSSTQANMGNRKAEPIVRITQILGTTFIVGSFFLALLNSFSTRKTFDTSDIDREFITPRITEDFGGVIDDTDADIVLPDGGNGVD